MIAYVQMVFACPSLADIAEARLLSGFRHVWTIKKRTYLPSSGKAAREILNPWIKVPSEIRTIECVFIGAGSR
jgi:hypothetical protein